MLISLRGCFAVSDLGCLGFRQGFAVPCGLGMLLLEFGVVRCRRRVQDA